MGEALPILSAVMTFNHKALKHKKLGSGNIFCHFQPEIAKENCI